MGFSCVGSGISEGGGKWVRGGNGTRGDRRRGERCDGRDRTCCVVRVGGRSEGGKLMFFGRTWR